MLLKTIRMILFLFLFFVIGQSVMAQKKKKNGKQDQVEEKDDKKSKFKKYNDLITKDAISDDGLFFVHKVEDKYYFEVPFELLGKDMLLVSRISKIAAGLGGGFINAGSKTNEQVIRWWRVNNNIHLNSVSYNSVANDSLPIYISVKDNNYEPIIAVFKIEAFSNDSTSAVIEVNDLFLTDVRAIQG